MFTMRFDLRAPATGAPATELHRAALEMAAWAETRGCLSVILCEHHMADDGYLPTPVLFAGALAGRTAKVPITVAAIVLPLYDPIRLAEEMAVVDVISNGRVSYVAAIGYRPAEYEMYGVDFTRRGKIAEEKLGLLLRAKTGEPFEHEGRRIHVTPRPVTPGGPAVFWGGGSLAAARRAGRHGIGFFAQTDNPALRTAYEQAAREAGHEPGFCYLPSPEAPTTVFVADDLDRAWEELGPYLLYNATSYAAWSDGAGRDVASLSFATTVEELRAERRSHRIMTVDEAVEFVRGGGFLSLHPLAGGLPPQIAWRYLRTVVDKVVPAVTS